MLFHPIKDVGLNRAMVGSPHKWSQEVTMNVQTFLADGGIDFNLIRHSATYDAQRLAAAVAVKGELVAKTVLLHVDDAMVLAVLPIRR